MSYFGHEIARCKDYSSLHYRLPFEKVWADYFSLPQRSLNVLLQGYLVDWDAQKAVWDGIFSDEVLGVKNSCCPRYMRLIWNYGDIG